jgi:hypothetical protein
MAALHVEIVTRHIKVPPGANAHPARSVPAPERIPNGGLNPGSVVEYDGVSAQKTCGNRRQGAVILRHGRGRKPARRTPWQQNLKKFISIL